jgi:signal transduction histidine kinase
MLFENEFGKLTEQQKEFVEKGCESTNRMIALVNDLLDVSRIEEGKFGFEFLENNIISAIRETVEQFRKQAEERKVAIVVEVPEENITMVFDFQKIKMVLSNLIDNAVRYTKEAGKVMVSLKNAFSSVEIEIKDSGIGIPNEQQEKVFGKFFRADNVVKMQTEGTGLGLYLVKNIIEQHKGVINFSSEEGVGTTFNIVLPKKPDFS